MKEVFDFAEGKMNFKEFEECYQDNPEVWSFLQRIVPKDISDEKSEYRQKYKVDQSFETNGYNVEDTLTAFPSGLYTEIQTRNLICDLVEYNYPEIKVKRTSFSDKEEKTPLEEINLSYIGGPEVDDIINEILENDSMKKSEKKKTLKEKFHIVPRKYPRWAQEPEWPASGGTPMRFVSQKETGDLYEYIFEDILTKEQRTVKQFM